MNKPIRILTAILVSLLLGGMFAYQDAKKNELPYQSHPVVAVLTDFFCGSLVGLIFYFGSGWLARRKERKLEKAGDVKFYEEVARELQEKPMVPGLWTKAFAEMGGDDAKARALYIKYRVAQLTESSRQQLEADRLAKQRQEEQKRVATKAADLQRLAAIEATERQGRTSFHRLIHWVLCVVLASLTIVCGFGSLACIIEPFTPQGSNYGDLVGIIVADIIMLCITFICAHATQLCYKKTR
jgi:hypothetical protein